MIVIFVSQSDKKAIKTTRWILDSFANRIGTDVWQTVITDEGLKMVHRLLRNHATKSMSVSCHRLRGRNRCELVWIVGNKERFNEYGIVPVSSTQHDMIHKNWENEWCHLPAIKALTGVAALWHDLGKSNNSFQKKLISTKITDPYRHEWVSCKLMEGLVIQSGNCIEDEWINLLQKQDVDFVTLCEYVNDNINKQIIRLPPVASLVCWIVLTHHRIPVPDNKEEYGFFSDKLGNSFSEMLSRFQPNWGYYKDINHVKLDFKENLLKSSILWTRQLNRWLRKLQESKNDLVELYKSNNMRLLLIYSRTIMMFSDYWVSSKGNCSSWKTTSNLFANTKKDKSLNQFLDEHLVRVTKKSVEAAHKLPLFTDSMGEVKNVRALRKKSPVEYAWQDKAVCSIRKLIVEQEKNNIENTGWFVVNMASTGCGKTFANAKIMQAMSEYGDRFRYTLALGLRTLTLQTGDEYRQRIGLTSEDMAVLIGSAAAQNLHDKSREDDEDAYEKISDESMMHGQYNGDINVDVDFLDIFFKGQKNKGAKKNKSLLYAPVLVTTIDHMMPAVETIRGGRHLLPLLRMMSSDLVIDEIDDFASSDLVAIARLVNLAGLFGRKVIISSATIPPDLAEGLFSAYQSGYRCYASFFKRSLNINCVWSDEFKTVCELMQEKDEIAACKVYGAKQAEFVIRRAEKLNRQSVKRKGVLIDCDSVLSCAAKEMTKTYFEKIKKAIVTLHCNYALKDANSGKFISVGIVRMANIEPCVQLSKYLLETDFPEDISIRLMTYHSRQILLLRHEQEKYLDCVLKRKGEYSRGINIEDSVMRAHIDSVSQHNMIFIVVATPVEEVGRDHDFDWAVVEPSSYRSIIQLSGRVLRHRKLSSSIDKPNIAIMSYNYKGIKKNSKVVFNRPGFECERYILNSHNLKDILGTEIVENGINSVPRILKPHQLCPNENLIDLEHQIMQDFKSLDNVGANYLHGWQDEYWWMTGLPQRLNPFRSQADNFELKCIYKNDGFDFCEYDSQTNEYSPVNERYDIKIQEFDHERFWLSRNYYAVLKTYAESESYSMLNDITKIIKKCSERYGSIMLPIYGDRKSTGYYYSDQLGLYKESCEIL